MTFAHFKLLPQEHIYSWLVRLYKLSGYSSFLAFQTSLGFQERFLHANKIFTNASNKLIPLSSMADPALLHHTTIPLWQLSIDPVIVPNHDKISGMKHMNEQQLFGYNTDWQSCRKCRKEDLEMYGTSYWHASHQIPSIFECRKHQTLLECAAEPVKNLYTEALPHNVERWLPVTNQPSPTLVQWQAFIWDILELCCNSPFHASQLKKQIAHQLQLPDNNVARRKGICEKLNPEFEHNLGRELLQYLFRDYSRPTMRGRTNVLTSMFANSHTPQGVRNPIYWAALAFWLRNELELEF